MHRGSDRVQYGTIRRRCRRFHAAIFRTHCIALRRGDAPGPVQRKNVSSVWGRGAGHVTETSRIRHSSRTRRHSIHRCYQPSTAWRRYWSHAGTRVPSSHRRTRSAVTTPSHAAGRPTTACHCCPPYRSHCFRRRLCCSHFPTTIDSTIVANSTVSLGRISGRPYCR